MKMFYKILFINSVLFSAILFASTKAHKIYFIENKNALDWDAAFLNCKKLGMNLLSIKTYAELEYLKEYIKKEYGSILPYWLGAYRVSGKFQWLSSGEPIKHFFWHKGEPNNESGNENCIHTYNEAFDWNDNDCELKLPFICDQEV